KNLTPSSKKKHIANTPMQDSLRIHFGTDGSICVSSASSNSAVCIKNRPSYSLQYPLAGQPASRLPSSSSSTQTAATSQQEMIFDSYRKQLFPQLDVCLTANRQLTTANVQALSNFLNNSRPLLTKAETAVTNQLFEAQNATIRFGT